MKVLGVLLVLGCSVLVCLMFQTFETKRIAEEESLCRFLSFLKNEYLLYAEPLPRIVKKANEPILMKKGYLDALAETESAKNAFLQTKDNFSISDGMLSLFSDFSCHFGREAEKEEEGRLCYWVAEAEKTLAKDKSDAANAIRLCRTLSFSFALGVLLLIL